MGLLVLLRRGTQDHGTEGAGHAVGCLRARPYGHVFGMPAPVNSPVRAGWWVVGRCLRTARWMPWHQEPMKDVGGHDRPRGVVNQALIRGCPNGETRQSSWAVTLA